jgi:lipopolysaccharide transport system ATP-binding protein
MTIAITAHNIGKKYIISHKNDQRPLTMRDAIADHGKRALGQFFPAIKPTNGRRCRQKEVFWALKDVAFEVKQGECVGIIGRNGAGKSTLLKILSRITEPTVGRFRIRGRVASLLEVGTGFHPELTGRENIFLNGAILGMSRREIKDKYEQIVTFSGVKNFIDVPVKRFSSGMRVRLAFAVAAHLDPEILIIDEVLAVGDADFQQKCLGKMDQVVNTGRTVLFVSHNMQAIKHLCDRALLLEKGHITAEGPASEVVDQYLAGRSAPNQDGRISPEMHRFSSPALEVFRLQILNAEAQPITDLQIGQTYKIRLSYRVHDTQSAYRIGLTIYHADGLKIANTVSSENIHPLRGNPSQPYTIDLEIKNILLAGTYRIGITVKSSHNQLIDVIEGLTFNVVAVSMQQKTRIGGGLIMLETKWRQPSKASPCKKTFINTGA